MLQTFPKSVSHIRNCIWQYFINWKLTCKNIFEWWVNPARRSCWDEMNARKLPVSMLPSDSWLIVTVVAPSEVGTKDYSWDRRESVKIVFNAWQGGKFNLCSNKWAFVLKDYHNLLSTFGMNVPEIWKKSFDWF